MIIASGTKPVGERPNIMRILLSYVVDPNILIPYSLLNLPIKKMKNT